ncbi:SpaA isopeptide-forming pilin-related protein, partial [Pontibacillus litoralis]
IDKGQQETVTLTAENMISTAQVALTKVDADNNEMTLEGAVFNIVNEKGNIVHEGLTTDEDGLIKADLKPGQYAFVETKAPFGYELDNTPIEFTIDKGMSEALSLTFENKIGTDEVENPSDDQDSESTITDSNDDHHDNDYENNNQSNPNTELPNTATNMFNWLLLGSIILVIGFGLFYFSKRRID